MVVDPDLKVQIVSVLLWYMGDDPYQGAQGPNPHAGRDLGIVEATLVAAEDAYREALHKGLPEVTARALGESFVDVGGELAGTAAWELARRRRGKG